MAAKLGRWLKWLTGQDKNQPLHVVCQRFLEVFRAHGVETSQIPRLVPQLKLADLQSTERLLRVLNPELLDQAAAMFGIRATWIEGVEDQIYDYLGSGKDPKRVLEHINAVVTNGTSRWDQPIRVLCTKKKLDRHGDGIQDLAPVVAEKIAELGEESIFRYHVYRDITSWDHPPARIELKVLARTVYKKLGITVPLYEIPESEMDEILEGRMIPGFLRTACYHSTPSLEDYALSQEESVLARETDELEAVITYIENGDIKDFTFTCLEEKDERLELEPIGIDNPSTTTTAKARSLTGKRAHAEATVWGPIRIAAQTIWAQEPTLSITDIVRRLRGMPQFKAVGRGESAIRKHIKDLAPEGVAGKPGRKPKKST